MFDIVAEYTWDKYPPLFKRIQQWKPRVRTHDERLHRGEYLLLEPGTDIRRWYKTEGYFGFKVSWIWESDIYYNFFTTKRKIKLDRRRFEFFPHDTFALDEGYNTKYLRIINDREEALKIIVGA